MSTAAPHTDPDRPAESVASPAPQRPAVVPRAALLAALCGLVMLGFAGGFRFDFRQSGYVHHLLMADAMLHGQLAVREEALRSVAARVARDTGRSIDEASREQGAPLDPIVRALLIRQQVQMALEHDWARVDGRQYGYWGPLTPLVAAPFVAIFGLGVSDALLNCLLATLNVGLFYALLRRVDRRQLLPIDEPCAVALTLLLGLGTVQLYLAGAGRVWFAAQIVTLTALLCALLVACGERTARVRDVAVGLLFGAAILARMIVGLTVGFFLVRIWSEAREQLSGAALVREVVARCALFGAALAAALLLQGWYNAARFGSPLDSGFSATLQSGSEARFRDAQLRYGTFNPVFLPANLKAYVWNFHLPRRRDGRLWFDPEGNSMFLVTPALVFAFAAWRRRPRSPATDASPVAGDAEAARRRANAFVAALLAGTLPLLTALLLYFATGASQFGNRYLLDAMPFLLLLVASGMRGRLSTAGFLLVVLSIAANLFGAYRFLDDQMDVLRPWVGAWTLPVLVALALGIWLARGRASALRAA